MVQALDKRPERRQDVSGTERRGHYGSARGAMAPRVDGSQDSRTGRLTVMRTDGPTATRKAGERQKHGRGGDSSVCDKLLSLH